MNKANISYTRNHLSELLSRVREGETILIVDRQQPVARLDTKALGALTLPTPRGGGDILDALLAERLEVLCLDQRLIEAGRKEGFMLAVRS